MEIKLVKAASMFGRGWDGYHYNIQVINPNKLKITKFIENKLVILEMDDGRLLLATSSRYLSQRYALCEFSPCYDQNIKNIKHGRLVDKFQNCFEIDYDTQCALSKHVNVRKDLFY